MTEDKKPKIKSDSQKELDRADAQFQAFDESIKAMTLDRTNLAPKLETEPSKLSQKEVEKLGMIYLKPKRTINVREKFNEDYRDDYNRSREMVYFTPYNKEIVGESIELWTKTHQGTPAEEWYIPTGKPVCGPLHLAERLVGCKYHRFTMQNTSQTAQDGMGQYYGSMAVETTIQRLDAVPVSTNKSIFMGAKSF